MKRLESLGRSLSKSEQKNIIGGTMPICTGSGTLYECKICEDDTWGTHGSGIYCYCDVYCFQSGDQIPSTCYLYNQAPIGYCP